MHTFKKSLLSSFYLLQIVTLLSIFSISSCESCNPWHKDKFDLTFVNLADEQVFVDTEIIKFKIRNNGNKVNTDDIHLELISNKLGVKFRLGKVKGAFISTDLTEILGIMSGKELGSGEETEEIELRLNDATKGFKEEKSANIKLSLRADLADFSHSVKKDLYWKAKRLKIINLNTSLKGDEGTFLLKNKMPNDINLEDIEVELVSKINGFKLTFMCNSKSLAPLKELLATEVIQGGKETEPIIFKIQADPAIEIATITVKVINKVDGKVLEESEKTWNKKNIDLAIRQVIPEKLYGIDKTEFSLEVANKGIHDPDTSRLQLQLRRIQGTHATIEGAVLKEADVFILELNKLVLDRYGNTSLPLKIIPNTDSFAAFELQLLYDGHPIKEKKTVNWFGAPKVKVVAKPTKLRDDDKTTQLSFKNESGFDLDQEMLKKLEIKLNNLTNNVEVQYKNSSGFFKYFAADNYSTTTLADLLPKKISNNATQTVEIKIETGKNTAASFEVELVGSTSEEKERKANIAWEETDFNIALEIRQQLGKSAAANNQIDLTNSDAYLTFLNKNSSKWNREALQDITVKIKHLTAGAKVVYGKEGKNIDGVTLKDILEEKFLEKGKGIDKKITVNSGTNRQVNFELELVGSTASEADKKVDVFWKLKPAIKVASLTSKIASLQGNLAKEIKLKVTNESSFKLVQADLEEITFDYTKSNAWGKLTKQGGTEDIKGKNLAYLLGIKELDAGDYKELDLIIDNQEEPYVAFENLKLIHSSADSIIEKIKWIGGNIIDLLLEADKNLTRLEGEEDKHFKLTITNRSGFNLNESLLKNITVSYDKIDNFGSKYQKIVKKVSSKDIRGITLWELLDGQILKDGKSKQVDLAIDSDGNTFASFKHLTLSQSRASDDYQIKASKIDLLSWTEDLLISIDSQSLTLQEGKIAGKLTFYNQSYQKAATATKAKLEKVIFRLNNLPNGMSVFYYDKDKNLCEIENSTTVWDILGKDLPSFVDEMDGTTVDIIIDPGIHSSFQFEVELVGSNEGEFDRKVNITWPIESES
jgi:hypothetical protein